MQVVFLKNCHKTRLFKLGLEHITWPPRVCGGSSSIIFETSLPLQVMVCACITL